MPPNRAMKQLYPRKRHQHVFLKKEKNAVTRFIFIEKRILNY